MLNKAKCPNLYIVFILQEEKEELEEFELLEQAADDNASFSSNASLVVNMMKRTVARRQVGGGLSVTGVGIAIRLKTK